MMAGTPEMISRRESQRRSCCMAPCSTARLWSFIMLAPLKTLSKPGMV